GPARSLCTRHARGRSRPSARLALDPYEIAPEVLLSSQHIVRVTNRLAGAGAGAVRLAHRLVATGAGASADRTPWLAAASLRRSGASSAPRQASAWLGDIGVILAAVAAPSRNTLRVARRHTCSRECRECLPSIIRGALDTRS